jgi:hypothetical protein
MSEKWAADCEAARQCEFDLRHLLLFVGAVRPEMVLPTGTLGGKS